MKLVIFSKDKKEGHLMIKWDSLQPRCKKTIEAPYKEAFWGRLRILYTKAFSLKKQLAVTTGFNQNKGLLTLSKGRLEEIFDLILPSRCFRVLQGSPCAAR